MMRMKHETQSGRRTDASLSGKMLSLLRTVLTTLLAVSMVFSGIPSIALAEAVEDSGESAEVVVSDGDSGGAGDTEGLAAEEKPDEVQIQEGDGSEGVPVEDANDGSISAEPNANSVVMADGQEDEIVLSAQSVDISAIRGETISLGASHSAAVQKDGSLWMWGCNCEGQLGTSTTNDCHIPVKILSGVKAVSLGKSGYWRSVTAGWASFAGGYGDYSSAIKADGSLWMWGNNDAGQLGDGTTERRLSPVKVMDDVVSVSLGGRHSSAIKADGTLWQWGSAVACATNDKLSGRNIAAKQMVLSSVQSVSSGMANTVAITSDGALWSWGSTAFGAIGSAEVPPNLGGSINNPIRIMDDTVAAYAGSGYSASVKSDGSFWMWGLNEGGMLGKSVNGRHKDNRTEPVKDLEGIKGASIGTGHTAVVKTDDSLWMWGCNNWGEVGDGTTNYCDAPIKVMDGVALSPSDVTITDDDTTTIQPKPLRNYYGAQEYMRSSAMEARDEAVAFVNAMDDYLSVLKVQTEKSAKSISGSNLAANHGKLLEQAVADKGKLVAMDANMPQAAKNAAYTALAQYLDTFVASEPFEKKVDMSADSVKVSTQLVNEIRNNLDTTVIDRKIGGYTVHLSALSMWSSGFETITVTGGGHTWHFTSVTNAKDTAELLTAYVEELKTMEKDALYQAMRSVFTELADVTGISDWSKRSIKKALEKRIAQLQQCGFGDLFRYCTGLREGYDIVSSLASATDEQSATRALRDATGMADRVSKIDLSDSGVQNGYVKNAMKKLEKAKDRLYRALFDYIYDPEREEDPGFFANLWNDVMRIVFQCPVDVYVYDAEGNEIGKVEEGVATCTDDISVSVNGDVKEVLIPDGMQVRIELVGTGEGSMTCVAEQAIDGEVTGRAVWYDVPLAEGKTYVREVSADAMTEENQGTLSSDAGDVAPSEWFSAGDQDAHVQIGCVASEGGTVSEGGTYPIGESVALTAYPSDEFHRLAGWYVGDELMCNDSTYRFPARESVEVEARFVSVRVVDDAWEGAVSKPYADVCAAVVLKRLDGLDDAAIGMSGMESEIPSAVTLRIYRDGSEEAESSQCEVEMEDGYRAIVRGLDLEGVTRVDVLLEDGTLFAAFMPAGYGVEKLFSDPYAILYPDGELVIQRGDEVDAGKGEPVKVWELDEDAEITYSSEVPWFRYSNRYGIPINPKITKVRIDDEIRPVSTAYWFAGSTIREIDGLENLDTSRTTSMRGMFENSVVDYLDLRSLDTSSVTDMKYMFDGFRGSSIDLSAFDTSSATNMYGMFSHCRALPNLDFSTFDTSKVEDMSYMFGMCYMDDIWGEGNWEFDSVDLSWLDTSSATTMCHMFEAWPCASIDVSGLDVSSIENASGMFIDCRNLAIVDLSAWKCPNLWGISNMFKNCENLKSVKLPDLSAGSLTRMQETFSGCSSLKAIDVSKANTSKVVNMAWLFANCSSLERVDLSGFDTSSVNYRWMGENKGCDGATGMLENCASLKEIVVGERFDVSLQDEFPASPVHDDSWWSASERRWIPTDEIRATRSGIADTYRTAEIVGIGAANVDAIPDQAYSGKALTPKPEVKIGGQTLAEGTDYTLSYKDNTDVGTATVTVTGRGDYEGDKNVTFRITPASVAGAAVTLAQASFTYDGQAKEPGVTVRLGSRTLRAGTDYTVGFSNNVNAGTATVTVTGKGNYEGTTSATFKIVPPPLPIPAITPNVSYRTHVQRIGWQKYVTDGAMSGTSGKSYRLEGINVKLANRPCGGGIQYRTHVQRIGWQGWRKDDAMAGTKGKSYRLEAIEIKLYGEMANRYDVYYRVHCQKFGWMGWAKNGQRSGSAGYSRRLEGIQIVLMPKGQPGPGRTLKGITQRYSVPFMQKGKK